MKTQVITPLLSGAFSTLSQPATPSSFSRADADFHGDLFLGINTPDVTYYDSAMFVNQFKHASEWRPVTNGVSGTLYLGAWNNELQPAFVSSYNTVSADASGNPLFTQPWQAATTYINSTGQVYSTPFFKSGRYHLFVDGSGILAFNGVAFKLVPGSVSINSSGVSAAFDVATSATLAQTGLALSVFQTAPAPNNLRNFRLYHTDDLRLTDKTLVREFSDRLKPFGVIRFMNQMIINNNPHSDFSSINQDNPVNYVGGNINNIRYQVPVNICVSECIETGKDGWFCIPHLATDACVSAYAAYVRDNLPSSLQTYWEFSNEVWNKQFTQHAWARAHSVSALGAVYGVSVPFDNLPGTLEGCAAAYGLRAAQVMKIVSGVFAASGQLARCNRVAAYQTVNTANYWFDRILSGTASGLGMNFLGSSTAQLMPIFSTVYTHMAGAPYFGAGFGSQPKINEVVNYDLDKLFEEIRKVIVGPSSTPDTFANRLSGLLPWAASANVDYICYEAGQHLALAGVAASQYPHPLALFTAANRDPRMGDMYRLYIDKWKELNGRKLMCLYRSHGMYLSGVSGFWGLMESLLEPETAKNVAVSNYYQGVTVT